MADAFLTVKGHNGLPRIISILSSLLERITSWNDDFTASDHQHYSPGSAVSAFSGLEKPQISIPRYLERIFQFGHCSASCFAVAYIYLDRFLHLHPSVLVDSLNVHRFLITAVLTAVKFMEDRYYNNAYFAKVGGISLAEMNYLEVDFLFGLRFDLNVTPVVFASYCSILEREFDMADPQIPRSLHCLPTEEESSSSHKHNELIV
ncbi:cyclin-P4-1-like [Phalaenopsis equestris]|uniref:cyclin-P4-1-like n=1 Tax=Phalaenopsis equestris TaxID=78828 RepID=UPI0009E5BF81|nr:cyclin-P4-1-like [Phalaenopsis equestris]